MGTNYNPQIVTSGLVLAIDAANPKSYSYTENLLINSQNMSGSGWGPGGLTVTSSPVLAPDGSNTANSLIETTAASAYHYIAQTVSKPPISARYTYSTYVKYNNRQVGLRLESSGNGAVATFNVASQTITLAPGTYGTTFSGASAQLVPSSNGWYRISLTVNSDTATSIFGQVYFSNGVSSVYTGDGTSGTYIWGNQLERSIIANRYITTTSANVVSSNTVVDLVNNNQNILFANNMAYSANNGNYFSFDGVSAIGCSNPMAIATGGSSSVTQEALLYIRSTSAGNQTIFTRGQTGVQFNYGMVINATLNQLCFRNSSADTVLQSDSLSTNTWYHLVISTTPSGSTGYVNGVQKNTVVNTTSTLSPSNNFWTIGCRPSPGPAVNENFFGEIALFRVYQGVAFTPEQVLQNFNSLRGRYNL